MSVLLSDPGDYAGGCFTTLELDGSVTEFADIRRGDGLLFVSEKWHSVQPVLSGTRRSFVTELWSYSSWPWGRQGPTADTSTGQVTLRRVDSAPDPVSAARAALIELYEQELGSAAQATSRLEIDQVLEQFSGCERELVVELQADSSAI
jgi:hypothetical protein